MATIRVSIKSILDDLCKEVKKAVQLIYIRDADVLPKSDLVKSVEVLNKRNTLTVYANDYVDYIESGRSKFAKKVPISAILIFIKKRKLKPYDRWISTNQLAFAIQNGIYYNGIKGKKGLNKKVGKVTLDMMFNALDKYFKLKINKQGEIIVGNKR